MCSFIFATVATCFCPAPAALSVSLYCDNDIKLARRVWALSLSAFEEDFYSEGVSIVVRTSPSSSAYMIRFTYVNYIDSRTCMRARDVKPTNAHRPTLVAMHLCYQHLASLALLIDVLSHHRQRFAKLPVYVDSTHTNTNHITVHVLANTDSCSRPSADAQPERYCCQASVVSVATSHVKRGSTNALFQ
jgi:hypothetical protein